MIVAHAGELLHAARVESKGVLPLPPALRLILLQFEALSESHQTKLSGRIHLFAPGLHSKRLEKRLAKSDIREPRPFKIDAQSKMIELRTLATCLSRDPRRKQSDSESESP